MSRRQRQRDQLRELCRSGALLRAVDLAFEHFADFGHDDEILQLLAGAIDETAAPAGVRRRFAELNTSPSSAPGQSDVSDDAHRQECNDNQGGTQ